MSVKILLVHNKFSWVKPLTWLSLIIRMVTCSKWNHVAILIDNKVLESKGNGVHISDYDDWFKHSNRVVLPMTPDKVDMNNYELMIKAEGLTYGFLDLFERFRRIVSTKWIGNNTFVNHNHKGLVCSDLACILLGIPEIYMPSELEFYPGLKKGLEYITYTT